MPKERGSKVHDYRTFMDKKYYDFKKEQKLEKKITNQYLIIIVPLLIILFVIYFIWKIDALFLLSIFFFYMFFLFPGYVLLRDKKIFYQDDATSLINVSSLNEEGAIKKIFLLLMALGCLTFFIYELVMVLR